MSAAYFVSDIHLIPRTPGKPVDRRTQALLLFLRELKTKYLAATTDAPSHLFLVGDVFDLWIGAHDYFQRSFETVVEAIRDLAALGIEVHYFEGNHDLHLESFWREELGAIVHTDASEFELFGQRVRVEHGDMINPDDHGYLFLRSFLRTRAMRWLATNLPSPAVRAIGERASRASRDYTSNAKGKPQDVIRKLIRAHAEREFARAPFDLIISGHVHVVDDFVWEKAGKKIRSVNLGAWFDEPRAFRLDDRGGEMISI